MKYLTPPKIFKKTTPIKQTISVVIFSVHLIGLTVTEKSVHHLSKTCTEQMYKPTPNHTPTPTPSLTYTQQVSLNNTHHDSAPKWDRICISCPGEIEP